MKARLAVAIGILTFGAGLLCLVALRWLGFLGLPPVFFLTLLLTGVPVGGLLLTRLRSLKQRPLASLALVTGGLAVLGCGLFLVAVHLARVPLQPAEDYAAQFAATMARFLAAAVTFFPLFVGFGLLELAAYREGIEKLGGRSAPVYALNLGGLMLSFLGYRLLLVPVGTTGLLALGLGLLCLGAFVLEPRRLVLPVVGAALAATLLVPGREKLAFSLLEAKSGAATLGNWNDPDHRMIYDDWTPYGRLTILNTPQGIWGFYEGMFYWAFQRNLPAPVDDTVLYRRLNLAFANLVRQGQRVAVLGAGGGLQVAAALRAGASRVVAVEVMPEVMEILGGELSRYVDGTYNDPRVIRIPKDGRRFLAETDEVFDCIVLASVETHLLGMREFFEPSQVMFTREAFAAMRDHLAPGGVLVISKFTVVDRHGIIFAQTFRALNDLGLRVRGYMQVKDTSLTADSSLGSLMNRSGHYLVLAQKGEGSSDALTEMDSYLKDPSTVVVDAPPTAPDQAEITDDRAFATGVLVANLGTRVLALGLGALAGLLLLVGAILTLVLRRRSSGVDDRRYQRRASLGALAAGFHFMVLEYLVVYRLMDRLDIPLDATFIGMVAFAGLAAAGCLALSRLRPRLLFGLAWCLGLLLAGCGAWLPDANLPVAALAAFLTGTLFPRILESPREMLPRIYVWDAYGALWGGLAALFVPVFFGFSVYQAASAISLVAAALATVRAVSVRPAGPAPSGGPAS